MPVASSTTTNPLNGGLGRPGSTGLLLLRLGVLAAGSTAATRRELRVVVLHRAGQSLVERLVHVQVVLVVGDGRPIDSKYPPSRLPMYSPWNCFMTSKKIFC